jgi:predicted peptidase
MSAADYPTTPGTHRVTTQGPDGQSIDYALRIPCGYDGHTATPVVLCLHFGGQPTVFYGEVFLELIPGPGFRDLQAILVAPTSPYGDWTIPKSESLVWTILTEVEQALHVATEARVVMGYSLGGIGAWHFASRFRHRWVAAIPVAGAPRQAPLESLGDLPLYVIHSRADQIIPSDSDARAVARLRELGAPVTFAELPAGDHFDYRPVIAELRDQVVPWLDHVWQRG